MNYIFNINELTLPAFWLAIFREKSVYVLSIEALFPPFQRLIKWLVNRELNKNRAIDLMDKCPNIEHVRIYNISLLYYNIFRDTFDWHENYYGFKSAARELADYSMAISLTTVNYTAGKQEPILLMNEVKRALINGKKNVFVGFLPDTLSMYKAYFGDSLGSPLRPIKYPKYVTNLLLAIIIITFSTGWILSRIRPFSKSIKKYFLTIDFVGDTRDVRLAHETMDGGPILFSFRIRSYRESFKERLKKFETIDLGEGCFNTLLGLKTIRMCLKDVFRLFLKYGSYETPLFFKIATLPFRRAKICAHLHQFPTDYYWGRDLYNPEHIIRRQELQRIGGKSVSFLSGYGVLGEIAETLSYISFDTLYIIGKVFHDKYRRTWAKDMNVIPIGSYGISPDTAMRIKDRTEKPKDIVIFTSYVPLFKHPKLKSFIINLARQFPDRTIWLQLKSYYHKNLTAMSFIDECKSSAENIRFSDALLNDLIERAGFAFSDPATIIMETLQFQIPSFVIDVVEQHSYCIYREFPFLCQNNANEAAQLIRAIESNEWTYPFKSYKELVEMPDISIFEQIRSDLGLIPSKKKGATEKLQDVL